jgi:hypothetical protein
MSISASHKKIYEVLSPRHYQFIVPAYQRPYAWGKDEARALVQDLLDAFEESLDEEYFLGSIVVVKRSSSSAEAEVVDGQQRLTSISILMAAVRSLLPMGERSDITALLVNDFLGDRKVGLRLRSTGKYSDEDFFNYYIRTEDGFRELAAICAVLPSSQQCIVRNALLMRSELEERIGSVDSFNSSRLKEFLRYVLQKGCLVMVESTDFASAYRIFSTMNNRGLALGVSDLIKALVLEQFQEEQDRYAINQIWEQEEADLTRLGSSASEDQAEARRYFELLFSHIHRIVSRRRSSKNLFDDFKKDVLGISAQVRTIGERKARDFVENMLVKSSDAYELILKAAVPIPDPSLSRRINGLYLPLLGSINNSDWQPIAISFLSRYRHLMADAHNFFRLLERTAAVSLLLGENVNKRAKRYGPILQALELGQREAITALEDSVNDMEKCAVLETLSKDIYGESYAFYAMLRLDSALAEGGISPSLAAPRASIEHVAPQTLKQEWKADWSDDEHRELVDRLGNLVLLSKRKNSRAQNFDFKTKKDAYFAGKEGEVGEVATFPTVTRVLQAGDRWTPLIVNRNQDEYISLLKNIWSL